MPGMKYTLTCLFAAALCGGCSGGSSPGEPQSVPVTELVRRVEVSPGNEVRFSIVDGSVVAAIEGRDLVGLSRAGSIAQLWRTVTTDAIPSRMTELLAAAGRPTDAEPLPADYAAASLDCDTTYVQYYHAGCIAGANCDYSTWEGEHGSVPDHGRDTPWKKYYWGSTCFYRNAYLGGITWWRWSYWTLAFVDSPAGCSASSGFCSLYVAAPDTCQNNGMCYVSSLFFSGNYSGGSQPRWRWDSSFRQ